MEKDQEFTGSQSHYDFGARIYDGRIGRFLSRDPLEKQTPSWSTYSSFFNNPIFVIDPDGRSGVASIDKSTKTITVSATIYFYGTKATPELAKSTANNIEKMWNDGAGKISIDGVEYTVKFKINGEYRTEEQVKEIAQGNTDAKNNFVRVEERTEKMNVSRMAFKGNSGYFTDNNLGGGQSTDAHEMGHSWGWYDAEDDWSGKTDAELRAAGYTERQIKYIRREKTGRHDLEIKDGTPGIMSPRGTRVKDEYGYDGQPSGKKTVDPKKRKVLSSDITKLAIDKEELKKTGKSNVGSANNTLYKKDGTKYAP